MRFNILTPLATIMIAGYAIGGQSSDGNFAIRIVDDGDGDVSTVSIATRFQFSEPQVIYDWKGSIYPLLGYGLFVEFVGTDEALHLQAVNTLPVLPKVPYRGDAQTGKEIVQKNMLELQIETQDGQKYEGCVNMRLVYDTTQLRPLNGLSAIRLSSNVLNTCSAARSRRSEDSGANE